MLIALLVLASWTIFGLICKRIAERRGLHPTTWFFVGFFLGLLAIPVAFFWPVKTPAKKEPPEDPSEPDPKLRSAHWYYLSDEHKQLGPLSLDALRRAYRDNKLTTSSYIWSDHMEDWKPLEQVSLLADYLEKSQLGTTR